MRITSTCHDLPCLPPPPTLWLLPPRFSKLHNPQNAKWPFIAFSPQWYLLPEMRRMPSFNLYDYVVTGGIKEYCLHPRSHTKTALSLFPEGLASWRSNTQPKERVTCLLLSISHLFSSLFSYLTRILPFPFIKHKWKPYQLCKCPVIYGSSGQDEGYVVHLMVH